MINQVLYVWLRQVQGLLETSLTLISENKDIFIVILGVGIVPLTVRLFWWMLQQRRQRQILPDTFPFDVIKPQSKVLPAILGGDTNDPLADYKIPYQERISGRSIHDELKQKLDESRWVLILAPTGIGKTREAANLAQRLNTEGWTILHLKRGEWLDALPRFPEDKIGTDRKLLFFLDDLNSKIYGGRIEQSPKADEPLQRLNVPLQERLIRAIEFYEKSCRKEDIRVIATARNEKEREFTDEPSEWEKLEFDKYPALWKRFAIYELTEPEESAIISVLREAVSQAKIEANPDDYACLAQRNDHTFRNIVENLRSAKNNRQSLTRDTFRDTLKGTWEKRYQEVVKKYPIAPYIYDAVELLEMVGISLYPFTVKPTALLIADGNLLQRLQHWRKIRHAWNYLISKEHILEPRDGQIEAKGRRVESIQYISPLSSLVLQLATKHSKKMLVSSLIFGFNAIKLGYSKEGIISINKTLETTQKLCKSNFGKEYVLENLEGYAYLGKGYALHKLGNLKEAITNYDKGLELKPNNYEAWSNRGSALRDLGHNKEAIISHDKAIQIKSNYYQAWHNRGIALLNLRLLEEAIVSFDKAIQIKPDFHEAWNNRGVVLLKLRLLEEAIVSFDKAIQIKPDFHEAWNNRGDALLNLRRLDESLACFDKALELKPDSWEALNNRGTVLLKLKNLDKALTCFNKAIQIQPNLHQAWNNRSIVLRKLGQFKEAITSCNKALEIQPTYYEASYNKGIALAMSGYLKQAIISFDKATQIKQDFHDNWYIRGLAFYDLGRLEEAITSFEEATKIKPNNADNFYSKACCYALQNKIDLAVESLKQAIKLNPEEYREIAKTDSAFDNLRGDNQFQALIQGDIN
ncbi:MAG: tetratricopeptide repeat protein [Coleofasciculus sp. A1-SPW-01]|uniref:tetratricopeptide repeat protein n=1 Tax=Coleofasciculus sp. A1-SPW-01 TaxID=3070819 RepID=UPI0033005D6E